MSSIWHFLTTTVYFGMTLANMCLAFLCIVAGFLARRLLGGLLLGRLARLTAKTKTNLDDMLVEALRKPVEAGVVLVGIGLALGVLGLPDEPVDVRRFARGMFALSITLVVTWLLFRLIDALSIHFSKRAEDTESKIDDALIPLLRKALKVFLAVLAFVVAVQNLGYSITGIVAGLGIGGLALALAAQDTVANVFGSIMILLDRPFRVGDWVKGADFEGTIEEVGFRSTRVRTFPRTLVSVPNKEMANLIIDNHQEMPLRRMDIAVGVTYETNATQMRELLEGLKSILKNQDGIAEEGTLVRFRQFGDSSLDVLVRGFTHATGFVEHTRIREEVLLKIMELIEEMGLSIAFPSHTLYFGPDESLRVLREEFAPKESQTKR